MAEWLKARASKARIPGRVSGVQIPLSPPSFPLKKTPRNARNAAPESPPKEFFTILHVNSELGIENTVVRRMNDPPRKRTYLNGYRGFKSLPLRHIMFFIFIVL